MIFPILVSSDRLSACPIERSVTIYDIKTLLHNIFTPVSPLQDDIIERFCKIGILYVLFYDNFPNPIGAAHIQGISDHTYFLSNFGILSQYRRQCFGTILFHYISKRTRFRIIFESDIKDDLISFYEKLNCTKISKDKNILWIKDV